ncbi:exonuclease [Salmonella enterica subsp. enterica]|nr:exonuclease [Salmonella enterica subsp. enterica]
MSKSETEYSFYLKVKNESTRKRLGFPFAFWWKTDKNASAALARLTVAMLDAGYEPTDFAKPVRVNFPVVDDLPLEGSFDTSFCQKYELGGEDGKTLILIPGAPTTDAPGGKTEERTNNAGPQSIESGIQETENQSAKPQLTVVATLPFRHRILAQHIGNGEYLYHVDAAQKAEILRLEMDTENARIQNMMLAAENVEPFKKAIEHDIHRVVVAFNTVFPVDDKIPEPGTIIQFFEDWFGTAHVDRGLLVKGWADRLKNKSAAVKKQEQPEVIVADVNKQERPRRSEKPTFRTINYELACGFYADLDLDNLRPAMDFAKRIIAEDREDWKRMSATVSIIPDIKEYDRLTIIDLVRKAPKAVYAGNPELRRTWCESFLAVHGVRDPDWFEYVPNGTPTTHEENAARLRQAGKCLRDIELGKFQCDEEKSQSSVVLVDEQAAPETVEPDTTEHHQDPQSLDAEPQIDTVDAAYQKIRADLHEARANIPPKNPVDVGKQLAVARGEYVDGISDPNDPKWLHENYNAAASNEGEKSEVQTKNDEETQEEINPQETTGDTVKEDAVTDHPAHGSDGAGVSSNSVVYMAGHQIKSTSKTKYHLMIDLETMGTNINAPIVVIACVLFDPQTGEIGPVFYKVISLVDAMKSGAIPDGETIEWWLKQSSEARSAILVDQIPLDDALLQLREFIDENADEKFIQVWGNGATFDNTILRRSYERQGIPCPWRYYNDRDVRTIVELGKTIGFDAKTVIPFEGVRHNALDDARHQAKYVSAIWQKLIPNQADF